MMFWKAERRASCCVWMKFLKHAVMLSSLCVLISGYTDSDRANTLMSKSPLIDGHNDLALRLRILHNNRLSLVDLHNVSKVATDISRLKAGHVQAQMFSVYVLCSAQEKDAVRLTLEQIDVVRRMCSEYKELELVTSTQELRRSEEKKTIACLISIEGGHSIDSSLPALRMFYQLGVRSMALTHTCNTPWAESSSKRYNIYQRENNSLTPFGRGVVEEMNRLGMIVDLSHSSWDTAWAVLNHSLAPVIFSHSSSYSICKHSRNVPDPLLHALKKNGGLIMVNLHSGFISCNDAANISIVADHFDHIKKVIGPESIGIGGDFDGADSFPLGLEDVSKYPALIQELLQRNWSEPEVTGVLRMNFLRVFEEVEKVRDKLNSTLPSEVQIPLKEIQNPCRMLLRPPGPPIQSSTSLYSRAQHGPPVTNSLKILTIVLFLSTLLGLK